MSTRTTSNTRVSQGTVATRVKSAAFYRALRTRRGANVIPKPQPARKANATKRMLSSKLKGAAAIVAAGLEQGADPTAGDHSKIPMYHGIGRSDVMRAVLKKAGVDWNLRNGNGHTWLHRIVYWHPADVPPARREAVRQELLDKMLAAGADANATDRNGANALHYCWTAAQAASLLKAGADPKQCDKDGKNAMYRASCPEQIGLYLAAGVDPWHRDIDGKTALDLIDTTRPWAADAARLILDTGIPKWWSPDALLKLAAGSQNEPLVRLLLEQKAKPDLTWKESKSRTTIQCLLSCGAPWAYIIDDKVRVNPIVWEIIAERIADQTRSLDDLLPTAVACIIRDMADDDRQRMTALIVESNRRDKRKRRSTRHG